MVVFCGATTEPNLIKNEKDYKNMNRISNLSARRRHIFPIPVLRLFSKPHGPKTDRNIQQHHLDKPQATSPLGLNLCLLSYIRCNFHIL